LASSLVRIYSIGLARRIGQNHIYTVKLAREVGQNHIYTVKLEIYRVYTVCFAGNSPNIRSYTVKVPLLI